MALQSTSKTIPLYGGLDTKTVPELTTYDKSLIAQNATFYGVRAVMKRYGQTAVTQSIGNSGTSIGAGKALGVYNNELLTYDGSALYGYAQGINTWTKRGAITESQVAVAPVIRSSGSVQGIVTAVAAPLELYAWEDTRGGIWYAVRDTVNQSFTVPETQLASSGTSPQIGTMGGNAYIFYITGGSVRAAVFSLANPALGIIS